MPEKTTKMNILYFKVWIEARGAVCRLGPGGMDCLLAVDHIEPGLWAGLKAIQKARELMIVELSDYFSTPEEVWKALDDPASSAEAPRRFEEWVGEQYLADPQARVEKLDL